MFKNTKSIIKIVFINTNCIILYGGLTKSRFFFVSLQSEIIETNSVLNKNDIPEGAVNGLFSVRQWKSVFFSKGNLQFQASTGIWRFADNQYDIMRERNWLFSVNNNNFIDLYACGTGDNPIKFSNYREFVDWGNNRVINAGPRRRLWRTLSSDEWTYVFHERNTVSGMRFAKAEVCGINGVVLFPDDWMNEYYRFNHVNNSLSSFHENIILETQWLVLEQSGVVFLPCAGYRGGDSYYGFGSFGGYWSSFHYRSDHAYALCFDDSNLNIKKTRYLGLSVRLVYAKDYV